ncbi:hypothetical protein [Desulfitobacterium chlororespirans]|uniref:Uncharacterized protein n=1 Tax=Desulfitobacterium chlororespirans DSM 11544 TaxID=1121395 RepID=A0A1M7U577_9FIRM|nr:hypothetical protein [Desulfitobacterium chlororespirans]SHN78128.1 hypothetical protein SAMN02745215_02995 [Desulfitobacterium chlororespirans DSM 11544]
MKKSPKVIVSILCIILFLAVGFIVKQPAQVPGVKVEMTEVLPNGQSKVIPPLMSANGEDLLWILEKQTLLEGLIADKIAADRDKVRIHLAAEPSGDAAEILSCAVTLAVEQELKEETLDAIPDLIVEEVAEAGTQQAILRKEDITIMNNKGEVLYPGAERLLP